MVTVEGNVVASSLEVRVFCNVTSLGKQGLVEGNGSRNARHMRLLFNFICQTVLLVDGVGEWIRGSKLLILGTGSFGAEDFGDKRALRDLHFCRVVLRVASVAAPNIVIGVVLDQKYAVGSCSADVYCLVPVAHSIKYFFLLLKGIIELLSSSASDFCCDCQRMSRSGCNRGVCMLQFPEAIVAYGASRDGASIVATNLRLSRLRTACVASIIPLDTGLAFLFLPDWFNRFLAAIDTNETSAIVDLLWVHQKGFGFFVQRSLLSGRSLHDGVPHPRRLARCNHFLACFTDLSALFLFLVLEVVLVVHSM